MSRDLERSARCVVAGRLIALVVLLAGGSEVTAPAQAQIPAFSGGLKPAADPKAKNQMVAAPTRDNPEATVATASGPIDVDKPVDDSAVQETLEELLPQYPRVRSALVKVREGVVTLEGHVETRSRPRRRHGVHAASRGGAARAQSDEDRCPGPNRPPARGERSAEFLGGNCPELAAGADRPGGRGELRQSCQALRNSRRDACLPPSSEM